MSLKDIAHRILNEKSGTASGTKGGTFCPTETLPETPCGTAKNRMNTGKSGNCPTVPNLYTGTLGHLEENGTHSGTTSGTLAEQWGDHAHLIEWFSDNVHRLPIKPYKLCEGEGWSLYYATPAATYRKILEAIKQGPEGERAQDGTLYGVLQSLHDRFGKGDSKCKDRH